MTVDQQQVVEVHGAGRQQALLVLGVDVGDLPLEDRSGAAAAYGLEVDQLVLGREMVGVDGPRAGTAWRRG